MKVNLKEIRKNAGVSQEEMAERSGFSISQISRWEGGQNAIPSDRLSALYAAYGCSIADIFAEERVAPAHLDPEMLDVVGAVSAGVWHERQE